MGQLVYPVIQGSNMTYRGLAGLVLGTHVDLALY